MIHSIYPKQTLCYKKARLKINENYLKTIKTIKKLSKQLKTCREAKNR